MGPDHVGPKAIINIEIQEPVSMMTFLNHQTVLSSLLWKTSTVLASTEDLVVELA